MEKLTSELGVRSSILPRLAKNAKSQTFAEYVRSALDQAELSPYAAERKSKVEAEKRGKDQAFTISDAMIGNIINGYQDNLQMSKLWALAWTLNKPIEEVVGMAFGFYNRLSEFQRTEAFKLWSIQQSLSGSYVDYYAQRISDLKREMEAASKRPGR